MLVVGTFPCPAYWVALEDGDEDTGHAKAKGYEVHDIDAETRDAIDG